MLFPGLPTTWVLLDVNNLAKDWIKWKQSFEVLIVAACDEETLKDRQKLAIFLHCLGQDGRDIVNGWYPQLINFNTAAAKETTFAEVWNRMNAHCQSLSMGDELEEQAGKAPETQLNAQSTQMENGQEEVTMIDQTVRTEKEGPVNEQEQVEQEGPDDEQATEPVSRCQQILTNIPYCYQLLSLTPKHIVELFHKFLLVDEKTTPEAYDWPVPKIQMFIMMLHWVRHGCSRADSKYFFNVFHYRSEVLQALVVALMMKIFPSLDVVQDKHRTEQYWIDVMETMREFPGSIGALDMKCFHGDGPMVAIVWLDGNKRVIWFEVVSDCFSEIDAWRRSKLRKALKAKEFNFPKSWKFSGIPGEEDIMIPPWIAVDRQTWKGLVNFQDFLIDTLLLGPELYKSATGHDIYITNSVASRIISRAPENLKNFSVRLPSLNERLP